MSTRTAPLFPGKSETISTSERLVGMDVPTMPAATAGTVPTIPCVLPAPYPRKNVAPSAKNATLAVPTLQKKSVVGWKSPLMSAMDVLKNENALWENAFIMQPMRIRNTANFFLNPELALLIPKKKFSVWIGLFPTLSSEDSPSIISVPTTEIPSWSVKAPSTAWLITTYSEPEILTFPERSGTADVGR